MCDRKWLAASAEGSASSLFGQGAHKALRIHAVNASKQSSNEYPDKLMDSARSHLKCCCPLLAYTKRGSGPVFSDIQRKQC